MGCMTPLQLGRLRRPSTRREAGSLGYSPRATGASQKSAGCEGMCPSGLPPQSGVQKGRTLPLRVWVSRRQVDGGWIEGALGPGCRSWAPHGVPRTEPSAPCCVAAAPELHRVVADRAFNDQEKAMCFWPSLPDSSTSAADEALLRGFKAREQPSQ